MRFLKTKIRLAQELEQKKKQLELATSSSTQSPSVNIFSSLTCGQNPKEKVHRKRFPRDSPEYKRSNPTKNIILN